MVWTQTVCQLTARRPEPRSAASVPTVRPSPALKKDCNVVTGWGQENHLLSFLLQLYFNKHRDVYIDTYRCASVFVVTLRRPSKSQSMHATSCNFKDCHIEAVNHRNPIDNLPTKCAILRRHHSRNPSSAFREASSCLSYGGGESSQSNWHPRRCTHPKFSTSILSTFRSKLRGRAIGNLKQQCNT